MRVLTEPRNALVKQYSKELSYSNADLKVQEGGESVQTGRGEMNRGRGESPVPLPDPGAVAREGCGAGMCPSAHTAGA